jgi:hypothetical protein
MPTRTTVIERLTRVEERQRVHIAATRENFDELKHLIEAQGAAVLGLQDSLNKYKGFWGGVTLVVSALWAALVLSWDTLVKKLGV